MYKKKLSVDWPFGLGEILTSYTQDARGLPEAYTDISVNISEGEKSYTIYVAAPGREKGDFKLSVENGKLTISAESKLRNENVSWLQKEWAISAFTRKFTVKDNVDTTNINAKYENGILEITLLKKEPKSTKNVIEVK